MFKQLKPNRLCPSGSLASMLLSQPPSLHIAHVISLNLHADKSRKHHHAAGSLLMSVGIDKTSCELDAITICWHFRIEIEIEIEVEVVCQAMLRDLINARFVFLVSGDSTAPSTNRLQFYFSSKVSI